MKTRSILTAALALCLAGAASVQAADVASPSEQAATKATIDTCATCHGAHGQSV